MKKIVKPTAFLLVIAMLLSGCTAKGTSEENGPATSGSVESETSTVVSASSDNSVVVDVPVASNETKKVVFDITKTHQTMDGFGAAYTWYGDRLLNAKNSEAGLDALFSEARLTILRFKNEYEYSVPGKASNAIAMARNYEAARERAALYGEKVKVLLCCWSPPASLKSDDTIANGYGTIKKNAAGEYMYKEYADWWVESVKYYSARGIEIDYVSIQNEIDFSPESYEGCRFAYKESDTEASYAKAFLAVYDAFKEAFGDKAPVLLGPETMGLNTGSLKLYTQEIIDTNPEALGGVAFHLYASGTSNEADNTVKPSSYMTVFTGLKDYFPNYKKWQTEFFIGKGIQTAELIWHALTEADLTAYLYWSGVWDDSKPGIFESSDLVEINSKGEWRLSANYYAMKHYSEFIRPGYVRVDAVSEIIPVKSCAFVNENGSKVAVVLVNVQNKENVIALSGLDYTITDSNVYQSVFGDESLNDKEMYKSLGKLSENGEIVLPAKSVTTIDITGYAGSTPVEVPVVEKIVYDTPVVTDATAEPVPTSDKVMINTGFETKADISKLSSFGSVSMKLAEGEGKKGSNCLLATGRGDTWNGPSISDAYFDHYGYMVKLEYDCMTRTDGLNLSCTSTFSIGNRSFYPDLGNNRVACFNMEAGKWYHCEGYVTLYDNMEQGSFRLYWETPDSKADFYLDNVKMTILYTEPAGSFSN